MAGIALAAGITWATSQLTSQHIGLSSEPFSAARGLAPHVTETAPRARDDHEHDPHGATRHARADHDDRPARGRRTTTGAAPTTHRRTAEHDRQAPARPSGIPAGGAGARRTRPAHLAAGTARGGDDGSAPPRRSAPGANATTEALPKLCRELELLLPCRRQIGCPEHRQDPNDEPQEHNTNPGPCRDARRRRARGLRAARAARRLPHGHGQQPAAEVRTQVIRRTIHVVRHEKPPRSATAAELAARQPRTGPGAHGARTATSGARGTASPGTASGERTPHPHEPRRRAPRRAPHPRAPRPCAATPAAAPARANRPPAARARPRGPAPAAAVPHPPPEPCAPAPAVAASEETAAVATMTDARAPLRAGAEQASGRRDGAPRRRPGAVRRSPLAVACAALAMFLAVLVLLTARLSAGHDPALGSADREHRPHLARRPRHRPYDRQRPRDRRHAGEGAGAGTTGGSRPGASSPARAAACSAEHG